MLIFWSLVRNSVVLAVYLLFSVACFLTVHEHFHTALNVGATCINGILKQKSILLCIITPPNFRYFVAIIKMLCRYQMTTIQKHFIFALIFYHISPHLSICFGIFSSLSVYCICFEHTGAIIIIFFIHKPSGYLIQIHPAHRRATKVRFNICYRQNAPIAVGGLVC